MVVDAKKTLKNLQKKGFSTYEGDHKFLEYYHNGKLILHTKISHSAKDLNDFLIAQMSKQCKLSKSEFIDLVNCPLTAEQYLAKLEAGGYISS
jgi:predicted RNA binding protein YcfA (HicA-like mRNA interferase family)